MWPLHLSEKFLSIQTSKIHGHISERAIASKFISVTCISDCTMQCTSTLYSVFLREGVGCSVWICVKPTFCRNRHDTSIWIGADLAPPPPFPHTLNVLSTFMLQLLIWKRHHEEPNFLLQLIFLSRRCLLSNNICFG